MKKAQGLSLNVIIIAAIALLVLVILSVVLLGRFGIFATGVSECEKQPGHVCTPDAGCTTDENGEALVGGDFIRDTRGLKCNQADDGREQFCCVQLGS